MKKCIIIFISALLATVIFTGCGNGSAMKINWDTPTKEQREMEQLAGGLDWNCVYSALNYHVDEKVKVVQINYYRLDKQGKWAIIRSEEGTVNEPMGQIRFWTVDEAAKSKTNLMFENGGVLGKVRTMEMKKTETYSTRFSLGIEETAVTYNKEVPISITVKSDGKDRLAEFDISAFANPGKVFKNTRHMQVSAMTVAFLTVPVK